MRNRALAGALLATAIVVACGSPPSAGGGKPPGAQLSPHPTATPSQLVQYDAQLLAQLKAIDFTVYETGVRAGAYVFKGAGLDYYRVVAELGYGGVVIDEWKAVAFNPESGKCTTDRARYAWNCSYLATSPSGHKIYASPAGGLNGYPPDLGDTYVELGTTVVNVKGATTHVPTLADVEMFAYMLKPMTPEQVVRRNQEARDYATYLHDTVASRIDFKTYMPSQPLQNFSLDRKALDNPSDPLHPYLYLHFARTTVGNQAFEFSAYEFRDDVPLSPTHCGVADPEISLTDTRCAQWFTSSGGFAVYTTFNSTRFDRPPTRIVIDYSPSIQSVTRAQMEPFIDSFAEAPPTSIA